MNDLHEGLQRQVAAAERSMEQVQSDPWRLGLHLMPPTGWLNDPNGLCFYECLYHVFFQYGPLTPMGGMKCWGHYVSSDLLHWRYVGTPLLPDEPFDRDGVYSGSALPESEALHLFYTGNVKHEGDYDYVTAGREANIVHVVSSDGMQMGKKSVVLTNEGYPSGFSQHIRDPKVWKDADGWYYMVLGARDIDDHGAVLLYRAKSLDNWEFVRELRAQQPFGYMWECPDLFQLEQETLLSVSPQGVTREARRHQNIYQAGYFRMQGDFRTDGIPTVFHEWDMGFDFYAPQTFVDGQGRRLLIGWMGLPDLDEEYDNPTVERGWQHALTIPREVLLTEDNVVRQRPIQELKQLRRACQVITAGEELSFETPFDVKLWQEGDTPLQLVLAGGLEIRYDVRERLLVMEFTDSALGAGRTKRNAVLPFCDMLRVIVDRSAVEVYAQRGAVVMTTRFYPPSPQKLTLAVKGGEGIVWTLRPMEVQYHG